VIFDYYIPKGTSDIQLEIVDASNKSVVKILSGTSSIKEVENMDLSQVFRYVDKKLSLKEGLNRFHWNLRQKGVWSSNKNRSFKNGPMVAPGVYTAKLTVNKTVSEKSFEIIMDPRVEADGITKLDIVNQLAMQQKVQNLLSDARKLQVKLEKIKTSDAQKKLKKLKNDKGAYPQQMLVSQISYLLNMISGADQKPGKEAEKRYIELRQQLNKLKH